MLYFLLAQSRVEALNEAFKSADSGNSGAGLIMLGIAGLAILLSAVIFFIFKRRSERTVNDPGLLFREICRAHSLTYTQRRLLRTLLRRRQPDDPCQLLIQSEMWKLDTSRDQDLCKPKMRKRIQILQRTLFTGFDDEGSERSTGDSLATSG